MDRKSPFNKLQLMPTESENCIVKVIVHPVNPTSSPIQPWNISGCFSYLCVLVWKISLARKKKNLVSACVAVNISLSLFLSVSIILV